MRGEFIDLNGERLYYYAAGSRGTGEPIVLIHGFPTSGHLWFEVVPKLPEGHRVIVVDLLGFGRSDAPPTAEYGIAAHGSRILALFDALQIERACVVGHDIGGAIAQWIALHAPQRVTHLGLVASATTDGWFAKPHRLSLRLRSLVLRLPTWCWLPVLRSAIAREFADRDRGVRSAELYLRPFATSTGAAVLRRQLHHLAGGQINEVAARQGELAVPVTTSRTTPWRYLPEEAPSEIAALISSLLVY